MVGITQDAITSIQAGTELPAVGWVFNAPFGIQETEDLNDRGIQRPQTQLDALTEMQSKSAILWKCLSGHADIIDLFALIQHSQGNVCLLKSANVARNSRIFCSQSWVRSTQVRINPVAGMQSIPIYPLQLAVSFPALYL
jgi:hypothetical protein